LAAAGVTRLIAAMRDPNPEVAGKGFAALKQAGMVVAHGLLEDEARELNIGFVTRMTRRRPWVRMKIAASLDGKTALENGKSRWLTGPAARRDGHAWRARACAVLTGVGTVRDDDPQLTVREVETPRQPVRVVVDSRLETPAGARVLKGGALIAAAVNDDARREALRAQGVEVLVLPNASGKVELRALMEELGRREMNEVHVEAGFRLNGSLLREGLVDELLIYLAPSLIGDRARGMFDLPALEEMSSRQALQVRDLRMIESDIRIVARPA
ncbi:MAG TPA: bifunctional diaminohydroxyphosphoribosylaminopyrimidine deaminase/5-amino-6-(5-phosphoribosylamino)uracil reductase RibD, partial [Burkholderiales bacterium]|nr:bifunctional diaminohydroxyphosphoribosylaminopyrimidine deaminase/5-amino-6-(5-phosphoribosylamino)uracil reductase RibD [Burkholderiales bacterium]